MKKIGRIAAVAVLISITLTACDGDNEYLRAFTDEIFGSSEEQKLAEKINNAPLQPRKPTESFVDSPEGKNDLVTPAVEKSSAVVEAPNVPENNENANVMLPIYVTTPKDVYTKGELIQPSAVMVFGRSFRDIEFQIKYTADKDATALGSERYPTLAVTGSTYSGTVRLDESRAFKTASLKLDEYYIHVSAVDAKTGEKVSNSKKIRISDEIIHDKSSGPFSLGMRGGSWSKTAVYNGLGSRMESVIVPTDVALAYFKSLGLASDWLDLEDNYSSEADKGNFADKYDILASIVGSYIQDKLYQARVVALLKETPPYDYIEFGTISTGLFINGVYAGSFGESIGTPLWIDGIRSNVWTPPESGGTWEAFD